MTTQQPSTGWEESIDLRKWIGALIRRWWLIAGITGTSIIAAVIYSYGFQASVYESSGGATVPSGSINNGIGLTPLGYQEFASSTPVVESVIEKLGLELSAGQLRNHYSFQVNENNFISVSATAGSAEQAFRLSGAWLEAYDQQVQDYLQQGFVQRKSTLGKKADLLLAELTSAREKLYDLNLNNPTTIRESQLADLESQLSQSNQRLRSLTANLIPTSEARLAYLKEQTTSETGALGGGAPSTTDSPSPGRSASTAVEEAASSPDYFELTQNLMRSQLSNLESDLVDSESSLRQLTLTDIPTTEAKLTLLKDARSGEAVFLNDPSNSKTSGGTPVPNPVYARLGEDIAATSVQLETAKKEAEILEKKVAVLQQRISEVRSEIILNHGLSEQLKAQADTRKELQTIEADLLQKRKEVSSLEATIPALEGQVVQLRRDVLTANTTRQELESEVARLTGEYSLAKDQLDGLTGIEPNLTSLSSLSTIREPALPADPISPNRTRNITLAAFLGLLVGIAAALSWDLYRSQPASWAKA